MTLITFHNGKPVMRDGKVGTGPGCCCGCGRCLVNGQVNHDYRTQAECERCRQCVETLYAECNGDCPPGAVANAPLVTLEFSSSKCGTGGTGSVEIGCGTILSATVTNGGSGYATETISEPTLTATATGGAGGVLSISGYTKIAGGQFVGYYVPTGISVVSGGSGYTDNSPVTLSLGTDDEWAPSSVASSITIRTLRPPDDEWTLQQYDTNTWEPIPTIGTGLVISLTLVPRYDTDYEASAVAVVSGGTGYSVGEWFVAEAAEGGTEYGAELEITSVGSGGEVTGIALQLNGAFAGIDTGVIESVVISSARPARKRTTEVCDVAVSIVQESPSNGTGATLTATVETASGKNFGKVTGLTVTNGGSGYVALCEKKTTVASCDECPPRESPESATCNETGGCPCGTWVVDENQEPCGCCSPTVNFSYWPDFAPSIPQETISCYCAEVDRKFDGLVAAFESAGWTVTNLPPPDGDYDCGRGFLAVCSECSRDYPKPFTPTIHFLGGEVQTGFGEPWDRAPCDPDQWVSFPAELFDFTFICGNYADQSWPQIGCDGGRKLLITDYLVGGNYYIPKCGQRITECSCCKLIVAGQVVNEVDRSCCADCPEGYTCYPGACNPLP